ncbi:hypothetical protein G7090_16375 [Leclercia sp. 29361]|uniref:hypothetical protein n=1 Tax=Leclercia sp. 29361 TaxID=2714951 RepID=UPI00140BCC97|nr:hypothetical protein [Leclercia sp. 29361]QIK14861.1 hypothetical protein G7090_16375 [Leclercia sp. 29361]
MKTTVGEFTLTLDMSGHVARSLEVLDELQRRLNELSPRISEEEALRILLLDMTFDYLKAKKSEVC